MFKMWVCVCGNVDAYTTFYFIIIITFYILTFLTENNLNAVLCARIWMDTKENLQLKCVIVWLWIEVSRFADN